MLRVVFIMIMYWILIGVDSKTALAQASEASGENNAKSGIILTVAPTMLDFGPLAEGATASAQLIQVCNLWNQRVEMLAGLTGVHAANFQLSGAGQAIILGAAGTSTACATLSVNAIAPMDLTAQVNAGEMKTFYFSGVVTAGIKAPFSDDGKASLQVVPLQFSVTVDKIGEPPVS